MKLYKAKVSYVKAMQITADLFDADHPSDKHPAGVTFDPESGCAHLSIDEKSVHSDVIGYIGDYIVEVNGKLCICEQEPFEENWDCMGDNFDGIPELPVEFEIV